MKHDANLQNGEKDEEMFRFYSALNQFTQLQFTCIF